jgi:hypothetical protein
LNGSRAAMNPAAENVSGLDRAVVAERHQYAQHIAERACSPGAPRNESGRLKIEHDEIGFRADVERADAVLELPKYRLEVGQKAAAAPL